MLTKLTIGQQKSAWNFHSVICLFKGQLSKPSF